MPRDTGVSLRVARIEDAGAMCTIYNDAVRSTTATFDTEPRDASEQVTWLKEHDARHPVVVAEADGQVRGWASLSPWSPRRAYDATAEISVYVENSWRGRGIGRALVAEVLRAGELVGLHTILARVAAGNPVSRRLHTSAGFRTVGTMHEVGRKFGRLLDVELLELHFPERPSAPGRPS